MVHFLARLQPRCLLLPQVGSIDLAVLTTYADATLAATTANEVEYVYTITNDGLLTLYNIAIEAEATMAIVCIDTDGHLVAGANDGRVEALADYTGDGLVPAASMECMATGIVTQDEARVATAACTRAFCVMSYLQRL